MNGLIIDNFAGGGGASTGIEAALGRPVDYAINHDAEALAMHAANHPSTIHLQEDVFKVSPKKLCAGRPVSLAWFSPDCTFHSNANGGRPVARGRRGLAGVAVKYAHQVRPAVIVTENVRQFEHWGPLLEDGRPDPARRGEFFRRWVGKLRALGYAVEHRLLVAADYGAPTTRTRLFIIARCDGNRIVWPMPTHSWRAAASVIDIHADAKRIDSKPRSKATLATIARGRARFGEGSTFLISYYGNSGVHGMDQPIPTVTTHDRFALIRGDSMRMLAKRELALAQGFPPGYALPESHTKAVYHLGNSVPPPFAEAIVRANMSREERMEVAG